MTKFPRGWRTHLDELQPFLSVAMECAAQPVVDSILNTSRMQAVRELFRAYLDDLQTAEVFVPAAPEDRPWYPSIAGCGREDRLALALLVARFVSRMERYDLTTDLPHLTVPIGVFTKFPRVLLSQLLERELLADGMAWGELFEIGELLQRLFPGGEDLRRVVDALCRTFTTAAVPSLLGAELASTATRWLASTNELLWPLAHRVQRLIGVTPDSADPINAPDWAVTLINDVAGERLLRTGPYRDLQSMHAIKQRDPDQRAQIAVTAAAGLVESIRRTEVRSGQACNVQLYSGYPRACLWALCELLTARLPLGGRELAQLIATSGLSANYDLRILASDLERLRRALVRQIELQARAHSLKGRALAAANALESRFRRNPSRGSVVLANRLSRVSGNLLLPLDSSEPWAAAAADWIRAAGQPTSHWTRLLHHCQSTPAPVPGKQWLRQASQMVPAIGAESFRTAVIQWFQLAKRPRTVERDPGDALVPIESNALVLRGLAWCCTLCPHDELARALGDLAVTAYRKVPCIGARMAKVGNACLWALSHWPPTSGLSQIASLRHRLRGATPSVRARLENALRAAARQAGLGEVDLAELPPPDFGMTETGRRVFTIGQARAELQAAPRGVVDVTWFANGKARRSVPAQARRDHGDTLVELQQCRRDMMRALAAERARLDSLFIENRRWKYAKWRQRYLDHPLVGVLARRLIWRFTHGRRSRSAMYLDGQLVELNGCALDWLVDDATVELWHPVTDEVSHVLAWREWLERREVRQPFKQAHREVYLLTDAERQTATYSNRFAGHILRQHQFHSLCAARGWENRLLLLGVDSSPAPPARRVAALSLRAEYWVSGIGAEFEADATASGAFRLVSTDQVRFYPIDGGEPVQLSDIPPVAFSEIMRDVDLFVGVSSVGNDPTWFDGGPGGRFRDYWSTYAFGELGESGRSRAEILERLLPRLAIAERCSVDGRFLVVRGELGVYRIHLNSAGVIMQPGDRYLCIVPDRSVMGTLPGKLYLPFEGDEGLSIILSKAYLLAADSKITDPAIVRQIRSHG